MAQQVAAVIDRQLMVWKSTGGAPIGAIELDAAQPTMLRFTPDGKALALATANGHLRLYDAAGGKMIADRLVHPGGVTVMEFSLDGTVLFSGGRDGAVVSSKATTLEKLATLGDKLAPVVSIVPFADGKRLAASDESSALVVLDISSGKRMEQVKRPLPGQLLFAFSDGFSVGSATSVGGVLHIAVAPELSGHQFSESDTRHFSRSRCCFHPMES